MTSDTGVTYHERGAREGWGGHASSRRDSPAAPSALPCRKQAWFWPLSQFFQRSWKSSCHVKFLSHFFFLFFHFGSLSTSLKTNYFTSQAKRYLRARCGLWAGGGAMAKFSPAPALQQHGNERAFVAAGGLVQGHGARR